jgi:hypothetical protein
VFKELRSAVKLSRSIERMADALELQNHIRKIELAELHGITIPDPKRKFTKQEMQTEISYDSVPVGMQPDEDVEAESWDDLFKDK